MINEACARCGHDKATHHLQEGACLGMLCNDCPEYLPPGTVITVKIKSASPYLDENTNKPHADWSCQCHACQRWKERRSWGYP